MSMLLLFNVSAIAFAAESNPSTNINPDTIFSKDSLSETDQRFLEKMAQVFDGYTTNDNGEITFTYSREDLQEFGFDDSEIARLLDLNQIICGTILPEETNISTRLSVQDGKIYFTYDDVITFLSAAAIAGPEAVYAALVALGSVSLGPVGTAIAGVVGLIGAPSLVGFCYQITQAVANQQGVYIGVEMNGAFPNIVSGTW